MIRSDYIISDFRKNKDKKDKNGAWVTLGKWDLLKKSEIDFTKLIKGMDDIDIITLHSILNCYENTTVSYSGINSPGNESSLFVDDTAEAIKKFQKIKGISPTGKIDTKTSEELRKWHTMILKYKTLREIK